jgi:CubicO group peptidase (beta-lactamase class C family)
VRSVLQRQVLDQGTFGHSGAGGQQAFADPRNGIAYGYSRRRFPFPAAAAPENEQLIRALYAAPGTSTI